MGITLTSKKKKKKKKKNLSFAIFIHTYTILFPNFHFRMAFLESLNTACDLNEYLFCKMPEGTLEEEVKVKTTWGKFTMIQNTHTRTEKYCTWEKAQICHAKSKKGRTPHKAASVHTDDNISKTDMPTGQEFRYPPLIFTDPTHTAVMTHSDLEGEVKHGTNFLGSYCEYCNRSREHVVGVSLLIGKRNLMLTTPTFLWREAHHQK